MIREAIEAVQELTNTMYIEIVQCNVLVYKVSIDRIVDMDSALLPHPMSREDNYSLWLNLVGNFFAHLLKYWIHWVLRVVLNIRLCLC